MVTTSFEEAYKHVLAFVVVEHALAFVEDAFAFDEEVFNSSCHFLLFLCHHGLLSDHLFGHHVLLYCCLGIVVSIPFGSFILPFNFGS